MAAVTISTARYPAVYGGKWAAETSGGQMWAITVDIITDTCDFFYSNDGGATWTEDTGAALAMDNSRRLSSSIFIDANDVVWVSGHFNDGKSVRRGTISGNAITWTHSAPLVASHLYTDLVAFAEGSDTRVFLAGSLGGSGLYVWQILWNSSTGFGSWTTEIADEGVTATQVRIDFNHTGDGKTAASQPHVWVAWLWTNILYCVKLVWSSGPSWTPNSSRQLKTNVFEGGFGFWDGTRFIAGMTDSFGPRVYERNAGDTATTDRTPGAITGDGPPSHIDGYYDVATGDIYLLYEDSSGQPGYVRYDRVANSWDSAMTTIEAEAQGVSPEHRWLRNEGGALDSELIPFWYTDSQTEYRTETGLITDLGGGGGGIGFWV